MKLVALMRVEFEVAEVSNLDNLRVMLPLPEHVTLAGPDEFLTPRATMTQYETLGVRED